MADFITPCYEDEIFKDRTDTDLHAFYMSQFNIEVENCNKPKAKENLKFDNEESFDFEVLNNWNSSNANTNTNDFEIIDQVINSNMDEQNIKEVLLDLDNIDFEDQSFKAESYDSNSKEIESFYENNDYIDDESLIDELCREDGESRFSPDCNDTHQTRPVATETILPSIETAFSKPYCHFNNADNAENQQYYNTQTPTNDTGFINNLEQYSYPNNVLYNLDSKKNYILPDTPTSCTEFNFERGDRKVSVSESIESDVQSSYYDENSETFDDDELFVNLDDFGLNLERENEFVDVSDIRIGNSERRVTKDKSHGERMCFWEHCYEKYPNQSTLVEHIERAHVNTYKGDEFSCLWKECARARRPFNARYKLLIHMRVHSGHKPNRCHHPGCGKAFSRLENLKIHVRSHTGERPYACPAPHCRKAFSNSSDRAKHQRTHFNARPYACGAAGCGKRYTDPSSLRKHVKSHPHVPNIPRTCLPPSRPLMKPDRTLVPSSPAKLTTLRCIRDKLTIPKLQKI